MGLWLWLILWETSSVIGSVFVNSAENSTPFELSPVRAIEEILLFVGSALSIHLSLVLVKRSSPRALSRWLVSLPIAVSATLIALFPLCGYFALYPTILILIFAYAFRKTNT